MKTISSRLLLCALLMALGLIAKTSSAAEFLYWTEGTRVPGQYSARIMKADLNGGGATVVLEARADQSITFGGLAFDGIGGHLYSGDRDFLFRANLDGSARTNLVETSTTAVQGHNHVGDVELDLASGKIYWTEGGSGYNSIHRANLDGSGHEVLLNIGFQGVIEGIALDLKNGKLYFQRDINVGGDTIEVMSVSGSGRLVVHDLGSPTAAAFDVELDPIARLLYWNQLSTDTIFKTALDAPSPSPMPVFTFANTLENGFHYDPQTRRFYVITKNASQIERLNADGTGLTTLVSGRSYINYLEVLPTASAPAVVLTWDPPADLPYGSALGPDQLNARANLPGAFAYDPPAGTILKPGQGQTLTVAFTPVESSSAVTIATVQINVLPPDGSEQIFMGDQFADGYEKAVLNPFWQTYQANAVEPAPDDGKAHTGARSALLTSGAIGQKNTGLYHIFPEPIYGRASIWFYDPVDRNYMSFSLGGAGRLLTEDWDFTHYYYFSQDIGVGGSARMTRSPGWHRWSIASTRDALQLQIDDNLVYTGPGGVPFDRIEVETHGVGGDTSVWVDDFEFFRDAIRPAFDVMDDGAAEPNAYLYWTEISNTGTTDPDSFLMRSHLNGGGVTRVMALENKAEGGFAGLAYDNRKGHIYVGAGEHLIRVNLDGSGRTNLLASNNHIGDVELDQVADKVYWTEGGKTFTSNYALRRANLDGSGAENLRSFIWPDGLPTGIALDPATRRLYYAHDGGSTDNDTIEMINLDGSGWSLWRNLGSAVAGAFDLEMDPTKGVFYWNQESTRTLLRTDLTRPGRPPEAVLTLPGGVGNGFHFDPEAQVFYLSTYGRFIVRAPANGTGFTPKIVLRREVGALGSIGYMTVVRTSRPLEPSLAARISDPPGRVVRLQGQNVILTLAAEGTPPLRYQWFSPETKPIEGATGSLLQLTNLQPSSSGLYLLEVANDLGSVRQGIEVRVIDNGQPRSIEVTPPFETILAALPPGIDPPGLRFQWRRNGALIPGAVGPVYLVESNSSDLGTGFYSVVVANEDGAILRDVASLVAASQGITAHDQFVDRAQIQLRPGATVRFTGTNGNATVETGEPKHARQTGGHSVWYAFKATANGIVDLQTLGSGFDTLLAVYAGGSLPTLEPVAANDDDSERSFGSGRNVGFFTSRVRFNVVQGEEYAIALDGFAGETGPFLLTATYQETAHRLPQINPSANPEYITVQTGDRVVLRFASQLANAAYDWYFNGRRLPNQSGDSLTLASVQDSNVGVYVARITNPDGGEWIWTEPTTVEIGPDPRAHSVDKLPRFSRLRDQSVGKLIAGTSIGFVSVTVGTPVGLKMNNETSTTQDHDGSLLGPSRYYQVHAASSGLVKIDASNASARVVGIGVYHWDFDNEWSTSASLLVARSAPEEKEVLFPTAGESYYLVEVDTPENDTGEIRLSCQIGNPPPPQASATKTSLSLGTAGVLLLPVDSLVSQPLTYTWFFHGQQISDAPRYDIPTVSSTSLGRYQVSVKNDFGAQMYEVDLLQPLELALMKLPGGGLELHLTGQAEQGITLESATEVSELKSGLGERWLNSQILSERFGDKASFTTNLNAGSNHSFFRARYE